MRFLGRRWLSCCVLAILCAIPVSVRAASTPKWSPQQLAAFADIVVIGRIDSIAPMWDHDTAAIYTYVTVAVDHVLKGAVPQRHLVLKQLGGRVGRIGLHVSDQADFEVGETALLFLEVRPRDGTLYTSALWQGKWSVERDAAGQSIVTRLEPSLGAGRDRHMLADVERAIAASRLRGVSGKSIEFVPIGNQFAPAGDYVASTRAFTLLGPLRYLFAPPVDLQAGGQPGLPGGGVREVTSAINKWNAAGAAFRYAPGTADSPPRCTTDELENGRVTISFMDPCHEMSNDGGTLAIGGSYYFFGGAGSVDWEEFNRASEGFIVMNDGEIALSYLTQSGCFEDVQTHELGHVLGLGHSADPNAIMFPTVNAACGAGPRGLGEDDIAGITYIYGFRNTTGESRGMSLLTPAPDVQVSVNGSTVRVSWGAPPAPISVNTTPTGYRLDFRRGHQDADVVLASFTTSATSMAIEVPPGITGDFNVIVTPVYGVVAGQPSFRRDFSICGGALAAVSGLAAGVENGTAFASWQPVGGATSYRATVGSIAGAADILPPVNLGNITAISAPVSPGFSGWLRIEAVNACGTSPPADIFVGGVR